MLPICLLLSLAAEPVVIETYWLYRDGPAANHQARPWSMASAARTDDPVRGTYLWLNDDWLAKPWAGVAFSRTAGEPLALTAEWLRHGFIRCLISAGTDRYGSPNARLAFQLRPEVADTQYQQLRARFIDQGRGLDEDPATWQEVLVPLSYWTNLKPGDLVRGVSLQCYDQPEKSFGFDDVALVRYDREPAWLQSETNVAQPEVAWPALAELPEVVRADRHPPTVRQGRFVTPDGRRVWILNPYCREDNRLDVLGTPDGSRTAPDHGLFDPARHGWLYQAQLTRESLCRLGFNSYSATMPAQPFWDAVGLASRDREADPAALREIFDRLGLPFFVDTVCWPWTIGRPAERPAETNLPAEAFTVGANHWTPYRITGRGRQVWLDMWRLYAERYRAAGVPVLMYELFNEPAYQGVSADHLAEFARWLPARYGEIARLNAAWGANFATWAEAARLPERPDRDPVAGRRLDYDECLAERFTDLVAAGVAEVARLLPQTLVGVQPMGGYVLRPREAVWKHRLIPHETVVLTPTGGGRWTSGAAAARPTATLTEHPLAPSPLENDLLLALAGPKMIFDNETYLRGQTARDTRNRLWEQVAAGLDGCSIFAWSRRGWAWWRTVAEVQVEADKYPYSALNPLARRTDALRGILDFATEVQTVADRILPRPWGPEPTIGLLYSWADARRRSLEPEVINKLPAYHAALTYLHADFRLLPSEQLLDGTGLAGLRTIVAAGQRWLEPETLDRLVAWVTAGGTLLIGEEPLGLDLYGRPLPAERLLGGRVGEPQPGGGQVVPCPEGGLTGEVLLRSTLRTLDAPGTTTLLRDGAGRPVAVERAVGRGRVIYQGADLVGYALAKVLAALLPPGWQRAGYMADGQLVPNVLLSRRGQGDQQAVLLLNRDTYAKSGRLTLPDLTGSWRVEDGLRQRPLDPATWTGAALATAGAPIDLEPEAPAVILLTRVGG